jgi:glutamate-1-semialdehyde 2,1-aminomutase
MKNRYEMSELLLKRALETIPLGTQTFSKSKTQLPMGVSPFYATHAKGSKLYDVDGNEYIDFTNSLASVTLGYMDPDVTARVKKQIDKGTIFSIASELEIEVAEKIVKMVPCAQMVRFGKNGSDATSGAIRLARAYTGKDHVFVCGYHGWQDWYIGSTARNLGVPKSVSDLTHTFQYNQIETLEQLFRDFNNSVAAVILEPANIQMPKDNFLEKVKKITHQNNAVLIFDEIITGFRYAKGGAQEFFNVIPDLACFGKGLANGYPISAIAGDKQIMRLMEEIFFSFTFGGELLSLAAASATLDKLINYPVIEKLEKTGAVLKRKIHDKISSLELNEIFEISGHPSWTFFTIKDTDWASSYEIKTLYLQEMFHNLIFTIGTHNLSFVHSEEDVDKLVSAYELFMLKVKNVRTSKDFHALLGTQPLQPLFKIR